MGSSTGYRVDRIGSFERPAAHTQKKLTPVPPPSPLLPSLGVIIRSTGLCDVVKIKWRESEADAYGLVKTRLLESCTLVGPEFVACNSDCECERERCEILKSSLTLSSKHFSL